MVITLQSNIGTKTKDAAAIDGMGVTPQQPALDHTPTLQNLPK